MRLDIDERRASLELGGVCVEADLAAGAVVVKTAGGERRRADALAAHLVYRELARVRSVALAFSRVAAEEQAKELISLLTRHL